MKLRTDTLMKFLSFVITVTLYIPHVSSFKGFPIENLKKLLAKRGDASDFRSVSFKGRPLEKETFVTRHEDIVLECEVGGSPSPTVHWLKDGTRIQQGTSRDYQDDEAVYEEEVNSQQRPMLKLGKTKSKLYLDCVSDRDEGVYTCVAETPYERITQSTEVKMDNQLSSHSRDSCITKKAMRGEPARIHLWTALRVEFQGAAVQLFCRAEGYPTPTCNWRYSEFGEPITDDETHKILPNGDLLIDKIMFEQHMGDYYCTCENRAGIDEVSTFLYPTSLE